MEPIRYVDRLNAHYARQGFPAYQWTVNVDAPWTPLAKPLAHCAVSMLTSGGISRACAAPWNPSARNDLRLDEVDRDAPSNDFQIHDDYYDHRAADRDLNCVFPIDRVRELAHERRVSGLTERHFSLGYSQALRELRDKTIPALVREVDRERPGAVLLTGG